MNSVDGLLSNSDFAKLLEAIDRNIQFGMVIIPTKPFGLAKSQFRWMKQAYKSALASL